MLTFLLQIGNQNAFLVQRHNAGGVRFSRDPLNPVNVHSRKVFFYTLENLQLEDAKG